MNSTRTHRIFLALVACAVLAHVFAGEATAQERIQSVTIEGNRFVSESKIRRIVRIKVGDTFSATAVASALKRLHAAKQFADVRAFRETLGGEVALTIVVREYTKIDGVRFEGNKHVDEADIKEKTGLRKGAFLRPASMRRDFVAIEELYRDKGYYRVSVKHDVVTEPAKNTKRVQQMLVYRIDEGMKVEIKHIDFFGARALDTDEIRKIMTSKEDGWLKGGEFKPKDLDEDMARIATLYREHGFLDAEVVDKELIFSSDGKGLDVFVNIREGKRYKIGRVSWTGNTVFSDEEITPLVTLREGEVFNDTEFSSILGVLAGAYWDRGYIYNSVSPNKKIDGDRVDVEFEITEGNPAHIREINIVGNTKTAEQVIRRELVVNPGDIFSRPRLLRSLREVFNLGFFNAPPDPQVVPAPNGDIDINLKVEEKQTGQFRLGAGFSALNSISGFIGVAETNFLGRGQTIGLDWEFSRFRQNVDLRFTEPWLYGTPTQLSVNIFSRVQDQVRQQFYDDQRRGASIRVGRPFPWFDYTSAFLRYSFESIELDDFSPLYFGPLRDIDWPQTTSSTALTIVRNSTDSPFRPTTGTRVSFTAEANGAAFLGGDVKFQSYDASLSWYEKLIGNFVLEMSYQIKVLDGYDSPSQVPDYELFRLGGNRRNGVRGYDFFEVVPDGNAEFLGGRFMQILSYEVTLPIAPNVYTLAFFDGGNTWNSFKGADLTDLRKGLGMGVRIELPLLGTIGFDYGYGFDKPTGAGWEPHISLGSGF